MSVRAPPYTRPETIPNLGSVMQRAREKAGLTRNQVANQIGVVENAIVQWELSNQNPALTNFIKFAQAIGQPPGRILDQALTKK